MLYGENTFLYSCNVWIFNPRDYPKVGFPDQNIQDIKHLELQAQPAKLGANGQVPVTVGATVQYFVDRGCDLQTFKVSLKELESDDHDADDDDGAFSVKPSEDIALWLVAHSNELLTALLGLNVSKTLTISLSYSQKTIVDDKAEGKTSGLFRDHLIKRLASQKNFTVTENKDFDKEFLGDKNVSEDRKDCEDDEFEDSDYFDEDDADSYLTWYGFSWCLRPQHSKSQTDSASA